MMETAVYDRANSKIYIEKQYKAKQLNFLYNTVLGRILLKLIFSTKTASKLFGTLNSGKGSIKKIKPFAEKYGIDLSEYGQSAYTSFNDFFTRKILPDKRPFAAGEDELAAVADSKLLVCKIEDDLKLKIKKSIYSVSELIKDKNISDDYRDGMCLIFRLTVDDYHRYCFFDSGRLTRTRSINGCLHTVGPISAQRHNVYSENHRIVNSLETDHFGNVLFIEVGALLVGKIVNREITDFKKGEEKGYFMMGGSTIVILFRKDTIEIDSDILAYSKQSIETKVRTGEKVGKRKLW